MPEPKAKACNAAEPCRPAFWVAEPWSQCSATCGLGFSTRTFQCMDAYGEIAEESCASQDSPSGLQDCKVMLLYHLSLSCARASDTTDIMCRMSIATKKSDRFFVFRRSRSVTSASRATTPALGMESVQMQPASVMRATRASRAR